MTAVTGLVALVGALAIALVAGPRVEQERVDVDRLAVAKWGEFVTDISAFVAGSSLGLAVSQAYGDSPGAGWVMILLAAPACVLSVVSVQRKYDEFAGGLALNAERRLASVIRELETRLEQTHRKSPKSRIGEIVLLASPYVALSATAVLVIFLWHSYHSGVEGRSWPSAHIWPLAALVMVVISFAIMEPYRQTLKSTIRYTAAVRKFDPPRCGAANWWKWSVATLPGIGFLFLLITGNRNSADYLVTVMSIIAFGVPPILTAVACAFLGWRDRGPWGGSRHRVLRVVRSQHGLAKERMLKLKEIAGVPVVIGAEARENENLPK